MPAIFNWVTAESATFESCFNVNTNTKEHVFIFHGPLAQFSSLRRDNKEF